METIRLLFRHSSGRREDVVKLSEIVPYINKDLDDPDTAIGHGGFCLVFRMGIVECQTRFRPFYKDTYPPFKELVFYWELGNL